MLHAIKQKEFLGFKSFLPEAASSWVGEGLWFFRKIQIHIQDMRDKLTRYRSEDRLTRMRSSPIRTFSPSDLCLDAGWMVHQQASPTATHKLTVHAASTGYTGRKWVSTSLSTSAFSVIVEAKKEHFERGTKAAYLLHDNNNNNANRRAHQDAVGQPANAWQECSQTQG